MKILGGDKTLHRCQRPHNFSVLHRVSGGDHGLSVPFFICFLE
jgi:hypothetical protein